MLSSRGQRAIKPALPYFGKFIEGGTDLYDEKANPNGYILMAVAESRQSFAPEMVNKLADVRSGAIEPSTGAYANMLGRQRFRNAFASTISRTVLGNRVAIDPEQLCVSAGCGSVLFQLGMLLLDPGDAVLLPTPTYAALYNDLGTLCYGRIVDIPTEASAYRLTQQGLEEAYERAAAGGPVKMLLVLNPNNPLGIVHSAAELRMAKAFCDARRMHLVVDEIYANSVYDQPQADELTVDVNARDGAPATSGTGRVRFTSMVQLCAEDAGILASASDTSTGDALRQHSFLDRNVHVLWGFSKDFAMSGYRCGVLYTHNADLLTALGNVNYFTAVSNDTQDMLGAVLEDAGWTDGYLTHCRANLRDAYGGLRAILDASGIPYVPAQAGMFVWLDLRAYLQPSKQSGDGTSDGAASGSASGEPDWAAERRLTDELFAEARILFTPGEACHAAEPGFFRCCFAWMPAQAVAEGFRRLAAFVAKRQQQ